MYGKLVSQYLGCDGFANASEVLHCMQSASVDHVLKAQKKVENELVSLQNLFDPLQLFLPWSPTVDGVELPQNPLDAMMNASYANHDIPMIMGSVANESRLFVW